MIFVLNGWVEIWIKRDKKMKTAKRKLLKFLKEKALVIGERKLSSERQVTII